MFKTIQNSLIILSLLGFCRCVDSYKKDKSDTDALFFDNISKSKGLFIDGKKEGIWEFQHENNSIEYKCISDNTLSNKSLFFTNIKDVFYPLGMKINDKKEGLWLNYDESGLIKNYDVFHVKIIKK